MSRAPIEEIPLSSAAEKLVAEINLLLTNPRHNLKDVQESEILAFEKMFELHLKALIKESPRTALEGKYFLNENPLKTTNPLKKELSAAISEKKSTLEPKFLGVYNKEISALKLAESIATYIHIRSSEVSDQVFQAQAIDMLETLYAKNPELLFGSNPDFFNLEAILKDPVIQNRPNEDLFMVYAELKEMYRDKLIATIPQGPFREEAAAVEENLKQEIEEIAKLRRAATPDWKAISEAQKQLQEKAKKIVYSFSQKNSKKTPEAIANEILEKIPSTLLLRQVFLLAPEQNRALSTAIIANIKDSEFEKDRVFMTNNATKDAFVVSAGLKYKTASGFLEKVEDGFTKAIEFYDKANRGSEYANKIFKIIDNHARELLRAIDDAVQSTETGSLKKLDGAIESFKAAIIKIKKELPLDTQKQVLDHKLDPKALKTFSRIINEIVENDNITTGAPADGRTIVDYIQAITTTTGMGRTMSNLPATDGRAEILGIQNLYTSLAQEINQEQQALKAEAEATQAPPRPPKTPTTTSVDISNPPEVSRQNKPRPAKDPESSLEKAPPRPPKNPGLTSASQAQSLQDLSHSSSNPFSRT